MNTIKVQFYGNVMHISYINDYQGNTNTCKMTEDNEFFFSKDYLEKNLDTLHFYVTPVITKNKVTKVMITEIELLETIKKFINLYEIITELYIEEEITLSVSDIKTILEMKYLRAIDCYDMTEKNYYDLSKKHDKKVNMRSEILFQSDFMNYNNIDTTSKFYQITEVKIKHELNNKDKEELEYLLKHNSNLEKITMQKYFDESITYLSPIIKGKNIALSIVNDEHITNEQIKNLKDIKKKSKTKLELSYSKDYQRNHAMKQLNLNLLRFCMVLVVFVCVGFASAERFVFEQDKENTEKIDLSKYQNIVDEQVIEPVVDEVIEEPIVEEEVVNEPETPTSNYINPYYQSYSQVFSELKKINSDTVGWIKVNNTNINYPVVKTTDNSYYLNHSFDKTENSFGWIYADYRSNFNELNQNTIIYGHHVIGTNLLFSTLTNIAEPSWYNNPENLTITFNTEKGNMKWQIFSIYVIPVTNDYLITNFNSQESFLNFIQKLKDRSIKDFGVEVLGNDKILTLSTCYNNSSDRVVVHAKRVS